jgi:AcrR family transcriptional regulator
MVKQAFRHTREEILGLSVPLFATRGFDGVSMRDIAAAVGVTPAALYYHFSDEGLAEFNQQAELPVK